MKYGFLKAKHIVVIGLGPGEDLLGAIEKIVAREKIRDAAIFSGFGTLDRVHLHWVTTMGFPPVSHYQKKKGPFELLSVDGIIANGEIHIHIVISDTQYSYGGHLEKGTRVLYLCEIALAVLSGGKLQRRALPQKRIKLLEIKEE